MYRLLMAACILAVLFTSLGVGVALAAPEAPSFSGEVELSLLGSVFGGASPEAGVQNMAVCTEAADGRWSRAWFLAHDTSKGLHFGIVRSASVAADRLKLDIEMKLGKTAP